jgi:hypothetical protein
MRADQLAVNLSPYCVAHLLDGGNWKVGIGR